MSMIGNFKQITPAQLEKIKKDPSIVEQIIYPESEEENNGTLDIDKTWQGIHFLLTGEEWGGGPPLANVIMGGVAIGDDVGYGPARYLTPEEVKEAAEALSKISKETLKEKFDPEAMTKVRFIP